MINKHMEWIYNNAVFDTVPAGAVGFIYLITRLEDGKKYVGKKIFHNRITKPPLKGNKRKRRVVVESDWRGYTGSNNELNESIKEIGLEGFERVILRICNTKSEMSYFEAKEQFDRDVLLRDDYFNGWISCRVNQSQLKGIK